MSHDTASHEPSTFGLAGPSFGAPAMTTFGFGASSGPGVQVASPAIATSSSIPTPSLLHTPSLFATPTIASASATNTKTSPGEPTRNVVVTPSLLADCASSTGFLGSTPSIAPIKFQHDNETVATGHVFEDTAITHTSSSQDTVDGAVSVPTLNYCGSGTLNAPYHDTMCIDSINHIFLKSISAMEEFRDLSHEELRFADYKMGNHGTVSLSFLYAMKVSTSTYETTSYRDSYKPDKLFYLQSMSAMNQYEGLSHEEVRFADHLKSTGVTYFDALMTATLVPSLTGEGTLLCCTAPIDAVTSVPALATLNTFAVEQSDLHGINNDFVAKSTLYCESYEPDFERISSSCSSVLLKVNMVSTESMLELVCAQLVKVSPAEVALECKGTSTKIFLILIATKESLFIFDCEALEAQRVCRELKPLLNQRGILKLIHDSCNTAALLKRFGDIKEIQSVYDTQIPMEAVTGKWNVTFENMLVQCDISNSSDSIKTSLLDNDEFQERPLSMKVRKSLLDDAANMHKAFQKHLVNLVTTPTNFSKVVKASHERVQHAANTNGERSLCFCSPPEYKIQSFECIQNIFPSRLVKPSPVCVVNDAVPFLQLLPEDLNMWVRDKVYNLFEIVLDKGRPPIAWIGQERVLIGGNDSSNRIITDNDISVLTSRLGKFGSDNRVGIEKQLHRISAIRNRHHDVIGLTMRVGRHVSGSAYIISDLLFRHPHSSILFLGEPGSGKTTVLREVTRMLAERQNVIIVDTSNEIAGDGDIPHPCVGLARRMMVPKRELQSEVMVECVQNHTPDVIVIDEIGRSSEADAARTCKNRGVRLIGSAHGTLRQLVHNPKLCGLVGGIDRVIVSDEEARKKRARNLHGTSIQKTKSERVGPPTFEIIVELKRNAHYEWTIIFDVGTAVDQILDGDKYSVEHRKQNPHTGTFHLVCDEA
jgi:stage III sporulation protein SpoIIIAA